MLVIFDCDGVLVDSERLGAKVFAQVLLAEGVEYTAEQCLSLFKGLTLRDCYDLLESRHNRVFDEDFHQKIMATTEVVFSRELKAIPLIETVLSHLKERGVAFCVASNGGYSKTSNSLKSTELFEYFNGRIFSAAQVGMGKPAPDLFLFAADQMGYTPDQCWVVEDSSAGVTAALAAKMRVIHLDLELTHAYRDHSGVITVNHVPEVIEVLQRPFLT